jgi:death-on-curing protein
MIYLSLPELLRTAERTLGDVEVRDMGLLESALARPQAVAFGVEAYTTFEAKAAALVHSIVRNHALIDGNKRLGLAALIAFLGMNGYRLTVDNDGAHDLILAIAAGELNEVDDIAKRIAAASEPFAF